MTRKNFSKEVAEALDSLPQELRRRVRNVAVHACKDLQVFLHLSWTESPAHLNPRIGENACDLLKQETRRDQHVIAGNDFL
jgi:hypothetical protein